MSQKGKVLVVDDKENMRNTVVIALGIEGYEVAEATSGKQAIDMINKKLFDLVITDLKMDQISGLEVLEAAKNNNAETEVIIMTAYASVETAVESMKRGAFDYITKPFNPEELNLKVSRAMERQRQRNEINYLRRQVEEKYRFKNILGYSSQMQEVLNIVAKISKSEATVMITGESGTGKELIAKAVHNNSLRKNKPFVIVNCGALPTNLLESELFGHLKGAFTGANASKRGLFEEANGGTFFLDEVGELDPAIQTKLLRVLEDGSFRRLGDTKETVVNVRFLSATNRDLEKAVIEGIFRQDLFYRLNVVTLHLPALRDRLGDIPLLVNFFLEKSASKLGKKIKGLSKKALSQLNIYSWPGNVRELENVIEQAAILCNGESIEFEDLPSKIRQFELKADVRDKGILEKTERECILQVLSRCGNNKSRTAKELGISEATLWRKLKKYNVSGPK